MTLHRGDWMHVNQGDQVREKAGRHVGRVRAIFNSSVVRVVWDDTGWISDLPLADVVRVATKRWVPGYGHVRI